MKYSQEQNFLHYSSSLFIYGEGKYEVVGHLAAEDLDVRIGKLEKSTGVLKRLYFVRYLYKGTGVWGCYWDGGGYQEDWV